LIFVEENAMVKTAHFPIGHHYIVEASGCDPKVIGSVEKVQQILVRAAEIAGAHVWSISFSKFPPTGVSGVVVISESHISTHTWPEMGYAALDIYTCGASVKPEKAVVYAVGAFGAEPPTSPRSRRRHRRGDAVFFNFITWEERLKAGLEEGPRKDKS
jgi:S-adenosylmethionine decarboxylase